MEIDNYKPLFEELNKLYEEMKNNCKLFDHELSGSKIGTVNSFIELYQKTKFISKKRF